MSRLRRAVKDLFGKEIERVIDVNSSKESGFYMDDNLNDLYFTDDNTNDKYLWSDEL